ADGGRVGRPGAQGRRQGPVDRRGPDGHPGEAAGHRRRGGLLGGPPLRLKKNHLAAELPGLHPVGQGSLLQPARPSVHARLPGRRRAGASPERRAPAAATTTATTTVGLTMRRRAVVAVTAGLALLPTTASGKVAPQQAEPGGVIRTVAGTNT